jgi:hypothetical protein
MTTATHNSLHAQLPVNTVNSMDPLEQKTLCNTIYPIVLAPALMMGLSLLFVFNTHPL